MKKVALIFLVIIGCVLNAFGQEEKTESYNRIVTHEETGQKMLEGPVTLDGFSKIEDYYSYYEDEYNSYLPNIDTLRPVISDIVTSRITLILGTWCIDSKQQVPRFIKILDKLNYPKENLTIIAVNRDLNDGNDSGFIKNYNLKRIPTMIFYSRWENEIGRIVESPDNKLETDMLRIFN
ncbi:MAG: hypothetical protein K9H84_02445 [Bacteroidales bacterium]|nr:hypothetical protein [Bacteroidales bacterium]